MITTKVNPPQKPVIQPFLDFNNPVGVKRIWVYFGVALVFLYLARGSVLFLWFGPARPVFTYGGLAVLVLATVCLLFAKGHKRVYGAGVCFVCSTLPGVILADLFTQSLFKWIGWALLIFVAGPLIQGIQARTLRQAAWSTFRIGLLAISLFSFAWYLLGLPSYWPGTFTGVTTFSMLLSPMAAMSVLICANYAMIKRSIFWGVLSFLSIPPCLLAGSRLAVLSLIAGFIVLIGVHFTRDGGSRVVPKIMFLALLASLLFTATQSMDSSSELVKYTDVLVQKGMQNTREGLWDARWREFNENPLFGIGVGMGEGEGAKFDVSGNINVEPGSSYLALLSMTGLLGALGAFGVFVSMYRSARTGWRSKSSDPFFPEVLSIVAFLFVHMAAEGWVLAVGSPLCLLFWLCLGRIKDLEFLDRLPHQDSEGNK